MSKKVTLRDIAKAADVSESTVSLVFNGKPGISEETRRNIFEIADQMQYPYTRPSSLKGATIGVLIRSTESANANSFKGIILSGIWTKASTTDFKIELLSFAQNQDDTDADFHTSEGQLIDKVEHWKGAIVLSDLTPADSRWLHQLNIPIVCVDSYGVPSEFYHVDNDNQGGACKGTQHLIALKHKRIAYIGTSLQSPFGYLTFTGYKQAMADAKLPLYSHMIEEADGFSPQEGNEAIERIIARCDEDGLPTAVFCSSDQLAYGVLQYISRNGLRIAVASMDDMPLSALTSPPLSTVSVKIETLGLTAISIITSIIENTYTGPKHVLLDNEMIVRESSFPA